MPHGTILLLPGITQLGQAFFATYTGLNEMKAIITILASLLLAGCDPATTDNRGTNTEELAIGERVFQENCQECHGIKASGAVREWQKRLPDGSMPAPPLNGTAHAWHHNDKVLLRTVNEGGIPLGGTMPAFREILSQDEKTAVLTYIKSLWPDDIYAAWRERNAE